MSAQPFKATDEREARFLAALDPILTLLGNDRDAFLEGAWSAQPLGAAIFDAAADPMAGVVTRDTYLLSFSAIHALFTRPGTFEFYLGVFRAVWGEDVEVEFVIPSPGVLEINIEALSILNMDFLAREIIASDYVYDEVIDDEGDNIAFQVASGSKTQQETDALVKELHPAGIFVTATLTIT